MSINKYKSSNNNCSIFISDNCSINLDSKNNTLIIKSISNEYVKEEFKDFMEHLIIFWEYCKINKNKYHMLLDLRESEISIMPLEFYSNLVFGLNKINKIMKSHLHSTCILCKKNSKIVNIFSFLFSVYNSTRPLKITSNENEVEEFYELNSF
jgi:hypothetical protein